MLSSHGREYNSIMENIKLEARPWIYVWKVGRRDFGRFHIIRIDLTVVHAPYFEANVSTLASKLIRRST
jgi:hypothetical protein